MKKALIVDGVAVNVAAADQLAASFHPDVASQFADVPDEIEEGWRETEDGWEAPPAQPPEEPVADPAAYVVDVPTFKMRFTPQQLVAVRASQDPVVRAFLTEVVDDTRTVNVNLALPFVIDAIGYLASLDLIGEGDVAKILAPT